jgi:hypothetical protein
MLDNFGRFNSFHDWIFGGYSADSRGGAVHLELVSDDFKEQVLHPFYCDFSLNVGECGFSKYPP